MLDNGLIICNNFNMKSNDKTIKVSAEIYDSIRRIKNKTGLPIKQIAKQAIKLFEKEEKNK